MGRAKEPPVPQAAQILPGAQPRGEAEGHQSQPCQGTSRDSLLNSNPSGASVPPRLGPPATRHLDSTRSQEGGGPRLRDEEQEPGGEGGGRDPSHSSTAAPYLKP